MTEKTLTGDDVQDIFTGAQKFGLSQTHVESATAELLGINPNYHSVEEELQQYLRIEESSSPSEFLRDILATSHRGIEADSKYWNDIPEIHLDETLQSEGYTISFREIGSDDDFTVFLDEEAETIELALKDTERGLHVTTAFEYPETRLETNNYPALIHAVNNRLLEPFGFEYVLLKTDGKRWQFYLIQTDRIEALKRSYGDNIQFPMLNQSVLEDVTPADYLANPIPTEHGKIPSANTGVESIGDALVTDDVETSPTQNESVNDVSIHSSVSNESEDTKTGVLDFEAINEPSEQPEHPTPDVHLDNDVEAVINEAETMLEDRSVANSIFTDENSNETANVADELEQEESQKQSESDTSENDDKSSTVITRLKDYFGTRF